MLITERFRLYELIEGEGSQYDIKVFSAEEISTGIERNLKVWNKQGSPLDTHLKTLWRYEMRQVQRIMAYSGAKDLIVDVVEFVEDKNSFGIVVERSGGVVSDWLASLGNTHWLRSCGVPQNRIIMWNNMSRVARALGIIHSQGMVHGQVKTSSIYTYAVTEPDFKLGGLEWSLRLSAERIDVDRDDASKGRSEIYSFASDWRSFGMVVSELLGVNFDKFGELIIGSDVNGVGLTVSERILLKKLINPSRLDMLDSATIVQSIDNIVTSISNAASSQAGTLMVLFKPSEKLASAIYTVTDGGIAEDEYAQQLAWVNADLSSGVTIGVPSNFSSQSGFLRLITENFVYRLSPFKDPMDPEAGSSWEIAFCTEVQIRGGELGIDNSSERSVNQPIKVYGSHREAKVIRAQLGPDVLDWSVLIGGGVPEEVTSIEVVKKSLRLVQMIEAVTKSLESYSVKVVRVRSEKGKDYICVRPLANFELDKLTKRLGLPNSAEALRTYFGDEIRSLESKWKLSVYPGLSGGKEEDVAAAFYESLDFEGASVYEFEAFEANLSVGQNLFLRADSENGTMQVIRRRFNIISSLDTRSDLLSLLDDPWRARRTIRNFLDETDSDFLDLDEPKQRALKLLWSTLPVFFVVGPPGVGKTRLATEVLKRKFQDDISSRLFLSAQGHDALDNLQAAISEMLEINNIDDLIVVRSKTPEGRGANEDGVQKNIIEILGGVVGSSMVADAPDFIKEKINSVYESAVQQQISSKNLTKEALSDLRAVSNLVLDSANIVISTANSEVVERMVEEREQFDWVIVEEAAKAIGSELIGPLMLSGRRLLIGDHHQLPPFGMDKLLRTLQSYPSVEGILNVSERLLGGVFSEAGLDEVSELVKDQDQLRNVISVATRLLQPFGTFVMEDERKCSSNSSHRPISAELTEQRRMDPAIARIVSEAFYDGKLKTAEARIEKAQNEVAPFVTWYPLPDSPVVVVDFDHVSRTGKYSSIESHKPRWNNELEVSSVIDVLRSVRAREGENRKPTLAILSPYKAQVKKIQNKISGLLTGELSHLKEFQSVRGGEDFVGTVDSFQGSEADLVVISLVRNNPKAGRSALGFLQESSRMNVMMSRAKWKMVVVGSLSFLEESVRGVNPDNTDHDLSFITRMLKTIRELTLESRNGVPLSSIVKPKSLRKR